MDILGFFESVPCYLIMDILTYFVHNLYRVWLVAKFCHNGGGGGGGGGSETVFWHLHDSGKANNGFIYANIVLE